MKCILFYPKVVEPTLKKFLMSTQPAAGWNALWDRINRTAHAFTANFELEQEIRLVSADLLLANRPENLLSP